MNDLTDALNYARPTVMRILHRQPNDAVDDVMQSAAIKIHVHLNTFRGDSSFKTWVLRICLNQALEYLRRNKRYNDFIPIEDVELHAHQPSPEARVIAIQRKEILIKEILRLTPLRRAAILRMAVGERTASNREKSARFHARHRIREVLEAQKDFIR